MELQRTKLSFTIVFGLAPFFKRNLTNQISKCDQFVITFDESLNKVSQDLVVRYWNEEEKKVNTRYLTSSFLSKAQAVDLLEAFMSSLDALGKAKLLQVSMDGPNVKLRK